MRPGDVEQWVVREVERSSNGLPLEDDRVELKRKLPENHQRAARRIAGHANQSRQDRVLWVIGIDESAPDPVIGLVEAPEDLAAWWTKVEALFDDVAPSPTFVNVPVGGGLVVLGISFDTSRPPYVLRLPTDSPNREVPWREGTYVRSANRYDLLRLLVPLRSQPELTLLNGWLYADVQNGLTPTGQAAEHLEWQGSVVLYLDCESGETLAFPDHRAVARVDFKDGESFPLATSLSVGLASGSRTPTGRVAERGDGQLVVRGPCAIAVHLSTATSIELPSNLGQPGTIHLHLETGGRERYELDVACGFEPFEEETGDPPRSARWIIVP